MLNLAEGVGRFTNADQRRHYRIAYGSVKECQALLDLTTKNTELLALADKLAAHVYKLILSKGG